MRIWIVAAGLLIALMLVPLASGGAQTVTPTPFVQPQGCIQPPNDYQQIEVNGVILNARTLAMLDQAQIIYSAGGGLLDFRRALTQGSYTDGALAASFGTHDGGGTVDISVREPGTWAVMTAEIEPMIRALRIAGFAAWLRDTGDLYPDSPIHIHAIAIGDAELSEAARAQLDGTFGYLRGFDGLPRANGIPQVERHGGPVLCQWMIDQGFTDLRGQRVPRPTPGGTAHPPQDIP